MSRYQLRNWIQYKLRVHHDKRYSRNQPIAHVRRSLSILGLTSSIPSETHIHKFLPVDFGAVDLLVHPGLGVGWRRQVVAQIGVAVRANCYLRRVLKPFCPLKYPQKTYACCLSRPGPPPAGARRGCRAPSWRMRIFLSLSNESQSVPVSITGHTEEAEPRDLLGGLGRDNKEQVERESGTQAWCWWGEI